MKQFNVLFIFLYLISPLYSQASYSIDDFGAYIITKDGIQKVPVTGDESELSLFIFREQYIIFGASNARGIISSYILYDIENNIASEHLNYVRYENARWFSIGIKTENNNILFNLGNIVYILDSQTLSVERSYYVENCDFADITRLEDALFQYEELNNNFVRYYYGGDYKYYYFEDIFFKPALSGVPLNLGNEDIIPFANEYKYVDIYYSEQLWERANHNYFNMETHISFRAELNGERVVIIVYSNVILDK